jgi:glycine hydroxymethyltransferase
MCRQEHAREVDRAVFPGTQGGPLVHVVAAKAVCLLQALQPEFKEYQRRIVANAAKLSATLVDDGLRLVSGGTDNHLMLADVLSRGLTGKEAEQALEKAHITVNKNAIPFDKQPPMIASGIRIGTPAVTRRGMNEPEMETIGGLISQVLAAPLDEDNRRRVRESVLELTGRFPLYAARRGVGAG